MWHTNQQHLGKVRLRLVCLPLRKPFLYICFCQRSWKTRGSIILRQTKKKCRRERPNKTEWDSKPKARWCVCSTLKEVRGVGWELLVVVVEGGGRGRIVNQAALPKVGTCKSGEWRVGTRPNDSSTVLYKYSLRGRQGCCYWWPRSPETLGFLPLGGRSLIASLSFFNLTLT